MIIIANFCAGCSVMTFGCVLERHAANFLMAAALFIAIPCCAVATWCADPFVKRLRGAAAAILAQDAGGTDIPIDASSATADQRVCFPCSRHRWNYSTRRPHMHAYTLAKRGQVRGGKGHIQEGITARSRCPCSTSCYHAWTPAVCSSMAKRPGNMASRVAVSQDTANGLRRHKLEVHLCPSLNVLIYVYVCIYASAGGMHADWEFELLLKRKHLSIDCTALVTPL